MTDNSILEKPRVRQWQHMRGSKLHCLKPRDLASSVVDRVLLGSSGSIRSEDATGGVSRPPAVDSCILPTFSKKDKVSNGNPTPCHHTRIPNWRLPKPDSHRHGNGGPIVVKSVNGRISCEGVQMNDFKYFRRYASAVSQKDA